ncbi:hypothetical protein NEOC65_001230 [Neochlamydia sp. AcF65]|nr:hypothetical protein [Neochlamydia sp. AcF65]
MILIFIVFACLSFLFVKGFYALLRACLLGGVLARNSLSLRKVYLMALKSNEQPFK